MAKKPKYVCPTCGHDEYCTPLDTYQIYEAVDNRLIRTKREPTNNGFALYCRECSEPAPEEFLNSAE